jgi:hypothetical protein
VYSVKAIFRPTSPADEAQLIAFLARIYSKNPKSAFVDPALLHWKFWAEREDFKDPRSYILERNGQFIAHAGLWPAVLRSGANYWRGVHMIDWAADAKAPGAGLLLVSRLLELFDFILAIGGGEMTRRILPGFGFKTTMSFWTAARPLKPLRQILSHQYVNWKLPLRFARNAWWSQIPAARSLDAWSAIPMNGAEIQDEVLLTAPAPSSILRDRSFLRYIQACPGAKVLVFQLLNDGEQAGTLALSIVHKQARIAGFWPKRHSPEILAAAYTLAQREAQRFDDACEIMAGGSTPAAELAAAESGLRVRDRMPVFFLARSGASPQIPFECQLVDNDFFFLNGDSMEFLT